MSSVAPTAYQKYIIQVFFHGIKFYGVLVKLGFKGPTLSNNVHKYLYNSRVVISFAEL